MNGMKKPKPKPKTKIYRGKDVIIDKPITDRGVEVVPQEQYFKPNIYKGLAVVTREDVEAGPLTMWDLIRVFFKI